MGQVVDALKEALFKSRAKCLIEFANAPRLAVELEELEAKQRRKDIREGWRHLLSRHGRLEHLQEPGLVVHPAPAGLFGNSPKMLNFAATRFRPDEWRRDHRDHC